MRDRRRRCEGSGDKTEGKWSIKDLVRGGELESVCSAAAKTILLSTKMNPMVVTQAHSECCRQ